MAKLHAGAVVLSLCVLLAIFAGQSAATFSKQDLEGTVRKEVAKAIKRDPAVGPALIRLVFHDCWVNGCDGSVLLEKTPLSSSTEKDAANNLGLAGFDVIDAIKAKVGDNVSCADIVVLAGRDATGILSRGNITYAVDTGRMDGVNSSAAAADATLPESTFDIKQLKDNFKRKGFTTKELVILTGAHAVGVAHLSSFRDRLTPDSTPIDASYQRALAADAKAQRRLQGTPNPTEKLNIRDMPAAFRNASRYDDAGVDTAATGVLDNSFYHANLQNRALMTSDWELLVDPAGTAQDDMTKYKDDGAKWSSDFAAAMAKLSKLPAEGSRFEIRKNCRVTNKS